MIVCLCSTHVRLTFRDVCMYGCVHVCRYERRIVEFDANARASGRGHSIWVATERSIKCLCDCKCIHSYMHEIVVVRVYNAALSYMRQLKMKSFVTLCESALLPD